MTPNARNSRPVCVIFDLDGTLVDSETLCCRAFVDLLPKLDEPLDVLVRRYRGEKLSRILADIERQLDTALPEDFETQYRDRVSQLFSAELRPVAGVPTVLRALSALTCVASSAPRQKIRQALSITGLDAHFGDAIFSSYDVGSWKPEPGLFINAADSMGCDPEHCVVVEDSDPGVHAALAAGMMVVRYDPGCTARPKGGVSLITRMRDLPQLLAVFGS